MKKEILKDSKKRKGKRRKGGNGEIIGESERRRDKDRQQES